MQDSRNKSLSPARGRLVRLMQQVNYGRLERLRIRGGDPTFEPPPRVVREWKIGGENGPRREADQGDFALKAQVVEFLRYLDGISDAVIDTVEIKQGLPFRMIVEDKAS